MAIVASFGFTISTAKKQKQFLVNLSKRNCIFKIYCHEVHFPKFLVSDQNRSKVCVLLCRNLRFGKALYSSTTIIKRLRLILLERRNVAEVVVSETGHFGEARLDENLLPSGVDTSVKQTSACVKEKNILLKKATPIHS